MRANAGGDHLCAPAQLLSDRCAVPGTKDALCLEQEASRTWKKQTQQVVSGLVANDCGTIASANANAEQPMHNGNRNRAGEADTLNNCPSKH